MRMKYLGCLLLAVISVVALYVAYLGSTYVDDSVTKGRAYGFVIGEKKLQVYRAAQEALASLEEANGNAFIEIEADTDSAKSLGVTPGSRVMVEALMQDVGFAVFDSRERWDFYFEGSYFNKLSLIFCEAELCEIYRHKKYFELP